MAESKAKALQKELSFEYPHIAKEIGRAHV